MDRLEHLRKQIDEIDEKILELLNKRAKIAIEVGKIKKAENKPLYVPSREQAIYERLKKINKGPFPNEYIKNVFREIISVSLSLEEVQKIAYLGPEGTFTHLAGIKHFGLAAKLIPLSNISDVFEYVEKRRCSYGVIPIENSLEGVVNHTLDMFMDSNLKICAEVFLEVSHHLMNISGNFDDIKKIYSHPHAIAQCRKWLAKNAKSIPIVEVESTAKAAEIAKHDATAAAICSEMAEIYYGLKVIEKSIEDYSNNYTRFLVIGYNEPQRTGNDKTSIMFSIAHKAGSLYTALRAFAEQRINMTKIESRPSKRKAWEYIFYVDIDGHIADENVKIALDNFSKSVNMFKILGSYPKGEK